MILGGTKKVGGKVAEKKGRKIDVKTRKKRLTRSFAFAPLSPLPIATASVLHPSIKRWERKERGKREVQESTPHVCRLGCGARMLGRLCLSAQHVGCMGHKNCILTA